MEEDSDTRSSFPSPFKPHVANGSIGAPKFDTISFRKCLDKETNVPFLQDGKFQLRLTLFVSYYTTGRHFISLQLNLHRFSIC